MRKVTTSQTTRSPEGDKVQNVSATSSTKKKREALSVYVFWSPYDGEDIGSTAKAIAAALRERGVRAKVINKMTSDLDDLKLVAKHRIIATPTVLIRRRGGREVYRKDGLATSFDLMRTIKFLRRYFIF